MKRIKKICIMIMILCIIMGNTRFTYAQDVAENEKVAILQELNILKGNGVSLDLTSQLSRSEAAAFIVRLLCQEDEVLDNKLKYLNIGFKDVSKNQWYTPYIGYCVENGIIDGYSDNSFRPNDKLGEKAFIKLVLTAMGYKYNVDFTWGNVFEYAYGIGLVKGAKYASGYKEESKYTREKVVDILCRALAMKEAQTKIRMIHKFVDKKVITKEQAIGYNLLEDKLQTEIKKVVAVSSTSIDITFNEKVHSFTPENVLIYETKDTSKVLTIEKVEYKDSIDTYSITTKEQQKMDEDYTVLIDTIVDVSGNPNYSFSSSFLGYRADAIESDFFMISKVEPISNNIINIYYTQPINDNALKAAFYTIEQDGSVVIEGNNANMMVSKLSTCDNGVSIYLNNYVFTTEEHFLMCIDGQLSSLYGVRLNNNQGDKVKFKSTTTPNDPFEVVECYAMNNRTIQLTFNKEVNPVMAEQMYMYALNDKKGSSIKISGAVVVKEEDMDGMIVRLTTETAMKKDEEYTLMINYISDITRQFFINEKKYTVIGSEYQPSKIEISGVVPEDHYILSVYVNVPLDQQAAENVDNYEIKGVNSSYGVKPIAIYYNKKDDPYMLKVYLPQDQSLRNYTTYSIRMLYMKDTMGNIQSTTKVDFQHYSSITEDVAIEEAKIIGNNTIKLCFNKEIAFDIANVHTSNFTLTYVDNGFEYTQTPVGANYINPKTVILTFDVLDIDKEYNITFKQLIDYGKKVTENTDNGHFVEVIMGE